MKLNDEETQKKVESNIKNIDVGSRIKDKEIDSSKINKDNNMTTLKKLPKAKYGLTNPKKEKEKEKDKNNKKKSGKSPSKKKHRNDGSGSGSGSGGEYSGDSGDDSGDDNNDNDNDKGDVKLLKEKLVY